MTTGAATLTRSSIPVRSKVWVAPPDSPVTAIRAASTSSRAVSQSSARIPFQVCKVTRLRPQRLSLASRNAWPNGLLSLNPTMS